MLRPATHRQRVAGAVLLVVVIAVEVVLWHLVVTPCLVRLLRPTEGHVSAGFFYWTYLIVSTIASVTVIALISPQLAEPIWKLFGLDNLRGKD